MLHQYGQHHGHLDASTGTLTLSGSDTLADYQAALRSVTYVDNSSNPSTATRTVSFQVNDGLANSNVLTRQITVTPASSGGGPVIVDNSESERHDRGRMDDQYRLRQATTAPITCTMATPARGRRACNSRPPCPAPASYQVFARWPAASNRATNVPIDITSAGGTTTVMVNQQLNSNVWVSLGTYSFTAGTAGSVTIRTTGTTGYVIADAVEFSPMTGGTVQALAVKAAVAAAAVSTSGQQSTTGRWVKRREVGVVGVAGGSARQFCGSGPFAGVELAWIERAGEGGGG